MAGDDAKAALGRRLAWAAALFVALLPVSFHLRFLSGDRILYKADTAQLQYPRYKILCDALQDEGRLPLWQTWLYTGSPFHANPEHPTLYPPVVLFASFCTPVWAINLTILTHLSLSALGMYFLVRRLWMRANPSADAAGVGSAGAIVAACLFSMSFWTRLDHLNLVAYGAAHALIPWVLLAADSLLEGANPRRAAGVLGLLIAFQILTGGLYVIPYAAIALALWIFFLGVCSGRERARRALIHGGLALLLAALIVCGKYLPYREWLSVTNRAGRLDYVEAIGSTLGGTGGGDFEWTMALARIATYTFLGTTIVLALLALPLWRTPVVRLAAGLVVLFFAIAVGEPVHRWLYDYVPVFDQMRNSVRAWTGVNAFLPLLAGLGIAGLFARFERLRAMPAATCAVAALLALILAPCLNYSFKFEAMLKNPERFSELPGRYTNWPIAARLCGKDWRAMYVDRDTPRTRNEQFISTELEVETPAGYLGHVWPRALELHLYGDSRAPLSDELRFRRRSTLSVRYLLSTSKAPDAPPASEFVFPPNVDGNLVPVENPLARARAIEPSVVAAVYDDRESEVAYAILDEGNFPLIEAGTIQLDRERALSAEELGALDALILRGEPTPQAEAAEAAMHARAKRVLRVGIPLSETDRANVLIVKQELALAALEREPAIDRFERLRSDATRLTRADATLGRWLIVSEPWSIYAGWTAATGSGAACAIEAADGVSSAVFLPAGESSLRADYAPRSARRGLWLYAAGVVLALLVALWPARKRARPA